MTKLHTMLLVCLCLLAASAVDAQSPGQRLSIDEAQKLVEAAIYPNKTNAELDHSRDSDEADFIVFEAVDPNPDHNGDMGFYAVNEWTGDVWTTAGSCSRLNSSKLINMLRNIRKRSKLSVSEFDMLRAKKPICDSD